MNIKIKRGDLVSQDIVRRNSKGQAVPLTGITVTAAVSGRGFYDTFEAVVTDANAGAFNITAYPSQTINWPLGELSVDAKYMASPTDVMHSHTLDIVMIDGITK